MAPTQLLLLLAQPKPKGVAQKKDVAKKNGNLASHSQTPKPNDL